jgi:hypothetical protein
MKVGITGYHADLEGVADFFEIDAHDLDSQSIVARRNLSTVISANHFFFIHEDPEVFQDRIELLAGRSEKISARFCLLKLPPRFFEKYDLDETFGRFLSVWKRHSAKQVMLDLPQEIPRGFLERWKGDSVFSLDPLWHKPHSGMCWKVHGWHDARWIRMYAESDLVRLKKNAAKFLPEYLIFGHSQRMVQIKQFLELGIKDSLNLADGKQPPQK